MSLIPEDTLKPHLTINLAPMIDFLFLMLAVFACLAVTRAALFDTRLDLVQLRPENNPSSVIAKDNTFQINLSIAPDGTYKWITDIRDYPMESFENIQQELLHQHSHGILPENKKNTQILLHIDKHAPWETIASLIFAVREVGFEAFPVYAPDQ